MNDTDEIALRHWSIRTRTRCSIATSSGIKYQGAPGRKRPIRNAWALDNADLTGLAKEIRALSVPTLILWGHQDRYLEPKLAQALCRDLRDCRFVFVDHAGHFVLDEQPQAVANAIQYFPLTKE